MAELQRKLDQRERIDMSPLQRPSYAGDVIVAWLRALTLANLDALCLSINYFLYFKVSELKNIDEFKSFHTANGTAPAKETAEIIIEDTEKSPEEIIDSAYTIIFNSLVVDLLITMGYGGSRKEAGSAIGKSGDGGIDGIIHEDKLGLDTIYIQAKRYKNTVPVNEIRDFAGSLLAKKARKGVFITTSDFPKSAREFVNSIEPKIILIDGEKLVSLMIEHNVGITVKDSYILKDIDNDYFEEM